MFSTLLYSTILVLNGVLNTHETQDTCGGINRNINSIQSAQRLAGHYDTTHSEQVDFLQKKYDILDCDRIQSDETPEIIIASQQAQCDHFQKLYCPKINDYLSQQQASNPDDTLRNDIQRFANELGGCGTSPKACTFIEIDDSCSKPYQD